MTDIRLPYTFDLKYDIKLLSEGKYLPSAVRGEFLQDLYQFWLDGYTQLSHDESHEVAKMVDDLKKALPRKVVGVAIHWAGSKEFGTVNLMFSDGAVLKLHKYGPKSYFTLLQEFFPFPEALEGMNFERLLEYFRVIGIPCVTLEL